MRRAMRSIGLPEAEWQARESETLGRSGFRDFDAPAETLSGGWRKRLSIAEALVQKPEIVLLDEPTNHLDLAGIEWLEKLLAERILRLRGRQPRSLLSRKCADRMAELNRVYPDGLFYVAGNYSAFLEKKGEFLHAQSQAPERSRESCPHRNGVAAARSQGARDQSQSTHRQRRRTDRRTADLKSRSRTRRRQISISSPPIEKPSG